MSRTLIETGPGGEWRVGPGWQTRWRRGHYGDEMVRCVRLWTGSDGASHFDVGRLDMRPGRNDDLVSAVMPTTHVTVEETATGGALAWHTAPVRQLVVTLAGSLVFSTRDGTEFALGPGDVLLAEDTAGSGHQWRLEGNDPWRRMYVVLAANVEVAFIPG